MLQVRAGHCPNCKEATPPGADYCPICGEDLNWQTVDGKKISSGNVSGTHQNFARSLARNLILFAAFAVLAVLAFALRERFQKPAAVTTKTTAAPGKGSTPAPGEDLDSMLDNSLSQSDNAANQSADNAVSNSVDNATSNKGSTPSTKETPRPDNADDLSDLDFP